MFNQILFQQTFVYVITPCNKMDCFLLVTVLRLSTLFPSLVFTITDDKIYRCDVNTLPKVYVHL